MYTFVYMNYHRKHVGVIIPPPPHFILNKEPFRVTLRVLAMLLLSTFIYTEQISKLSSFLKLN